MLSQLAAVVIALAAVATALGILSRLRPVRWLGRTLIGQPVLGAFRREVGDVVDDRLAPIDGRLSAIEAELRPNHGGSLRDAVDKVVDQTAT